MPYVRRKFYCIECGQYTMRKLSSKQQRRCVECGINAMLRSVQSMAAKSGDAYAAWQQSSGPNGRPRHEKGNG